MLVLRVSGLLGVDARPNSVSRILTAPEPALTLSAASIFNYVLHQEVGHLLEQALATGLAGTPDAATARNVTLAEVAEPAGRPVAFGTHTRSEKF